MFYSKFMFVKKGPLSKVWIAAHFHRKLNKTHVLGTDIDVSAKSILDPSAPLALRLSGQLLLGLVRIYQRKVKYLQEDCSDALTKMKMIFRPGNVDLPEGTETAPSGTITHADDAVDIDMIIPEIPLDDLDTILDPNLMNASETEFSVAPSFASFDADANDITLKDNDIDLGGVDLLDGFNDDLVLAPFNEDGFNDDSKVSDVEMPRFENHGDEFDIEVGDDSQALGHLNKSSDYSQMGQEFSGLDTTTDADNMSVVQESKAKAKPKPKKRKLETIDKSTEIPGKNIASQLKDTSDIVTERTMIPLMGKRSKYSHNVNLSLETLLAQPSTLNVSFLGSDLLNVFSRNARVVNVEGREKKSSKKRKADDEVDLNQDYDLNNSNEFEFEDINDVDSSIANSFAITPAKGDEPIDEPEQKLSQSTLSFQSARQELDDDVADFFDEKSSSQAEGEEKEALFGWTSRAKKMHQVLKSEMKNKKSVQFDKIVEGKARKTAAGVFYQLLVLKSHNIVQVEQKQPFEDITILKGKTFANAH